MADREQEYWKSPAGRAKLAYNAALGNGATPDQALAKAVEAAQGASGPAKKP